MYSIKVLVVAIDQLTLLLVSEDIMDRTIPSPHPAGLVLGHVTPVWRQKRQLELQREGWCY